jgi:hypothetical protein
MATQAIEFGIALAQSVVPSRGSSAISMRQLLPSPPTRSPI